MSFNSQVVRCLYGICFMLSLSALAAGAVMAEFPAVQYIASYTTLSSEKKMTLVKQLSKPGWGKLSRDERMAVQLACLQRSKVTIGKNSSRELRVVTDEGEKMILKIAGDYLNSLPPSQAQAHPAAGDVYGEIPENAQRVSRNVSIDPAVVRWHSTGLYAAPGELVTVVFPEVWIGKGLRVQVSGHTDNLSLKGSLLRTPASPARSFPVDRTAVEVFASYGGAIYIDTGAKPREGAVFSVEVCKALEAPYFVLGKTDVKLWRSTLRNASAPYAEFVTDRLAFSFPSEWIRDLDDPTEILKYWDNVVALHDQLGGLANIRSGPERVNVDIQISVGLFHAGYPAQGPQKQCRGMLDLEKLKKRGNWGWFHELGHEAQRRPDKVWGWNNPYTFDDSIETTVNLFSTHAMDCLKMNDRGGWSWTAVADDVARRARDALAANKPFRELGPGQKLAMYLQLRDQFGWEPIRTVLTGYSNDQNCRPQVLPKSNQAKRDAFLIRMSQATQHNLTPFLQDLWGIPMSQEAVAQIADLPVWMPNSFSPDRPDIADRK